MKKLLVAALAGLTILGLCGCGIKINVNNDAADYNIGNARITDKIENIDLDWAAGEVNILYAPGNEIILEEKYSGDLPDDKKMHWAVEGTTLKIRYDISVDIFSIKINNGKTLNMTLPQDLILNDLDIDVASANLNGDNIRAYSADIDAASGEIRMSFAEEMKETDIDTASGGVNVSFAKKVGTLDMDAASGNVMAELTGGADSLNVSTASGKVQMNAGAKVGDVKISTASGSVSAGFVQVPDRADIDTASGAVNLAIPENSDVTVEIDTASGNFNSDVAFKMDGKKYVAGAGTATIEIDTASGDITISKK